MGVQNLKISVSGVRGIVGDTLTPWLVSRFTQAFATYTEGGRIVVGRDTRTSGEWMWNAAVSGLLSAGAVPVDLGIVPIPVVEVMVRYLKASGGIGITASHNPAQWNALKFFRSDGIYLDPYQGEDLLSIYYQGNFRASPHSKIEYFKDAIRIHHDLVLKHVDVEKITSAKISVAVDPVNGAACLATPAFLKRLGCRYKVINSTPDGHFRHPPEPTPANLMQLSQLVSKGGFDIGFAQDPDADRLALVDEKGRPLSEELTLALCVYHVLKKIKTPVVVNVSTSQLIDDIATMYGVPVYRSKVGEVNVVEKMLSTGALMGGEGNGGVIFSPVNAGRDSYVGMGLILELMASEEKPVSEIVKKFPSYAMIKDKVPVPSRRISPLIGKLVEKFGKFKMDFTDGIKFWPEERLWVQVRPSNTEPVVRVIVEGPDEVKIKKWVNIIKEMLVGG